MFSICTTAIAQETTWDLSARNVSLLISKCLILKIRLEKENSIEKFSQEQMAEFDLQFIIHLLKSPATYSMIL